MNDTANMTQVTDATNNLANITTAILQMARLLEMFADTAKGDKAVSPGEIATSLFRINEAYEPLDKAVKKIYHTKDFLNKSLLPERLADFGLDMIRVPEIGRSFSILDKYSASFVDKEKGYEWLRDNGLADIITETVNAGTLASAMRNMVLEQGIEPPEDLIKVTKYNATSINKYTPK